jgi:hypothetical protein
MDDIQILNEERKTYLIGPKKKKIELEMLSISKYYDVFVPEFLLFLNFFEKDTERLEIKLPTGKQWTKKKEMSTLKSQIRRIFSYAQVRVRFYKLLKRSGYVKFSRKYFERNVTPSLMVELFLRIYKFNIDDFKKKLSEVADNILLPSLQSPISTGISSIGVGSSRRSGGPSGGREKLEPRFRVLPK